MISPTTARPQQRYDHRLRELVHRTGDLTIATDLGIVPLEKADLCEKMGIMLFHRSLC